MIIDKHKIGLGENKIIQMKVSVLPSGTPIQIEANVFRSKKEGPVILVLGGLHGDEINGVEIVRSTIQSKLFKKLKKGSVIAVPLLNVYGFINFSREVPDGKDINRSFPGSSKGSLASQVANKLSKEILPHVDLSVDFHTGGKSIYNIPQIRITEGIEGDLKLAEVFNTDFIVYSKLIPKSLRKEMYRKQKTMLVFEGGESLRLDEYSIQEGINGLKRIMNHLGMIDEQVKPKKTRLIKESYWERASVSGIFKALVSAGEKVEKGEKIGAISTPFNENVKSIKSKKEGYVYGINNNPVVNQGDALFHIGQ